MSKSYKWTVSPEALERVKEAKRRVDSGESFQAVKADMKMGSNTYYEGVKLLGLNKKQRRTKAFLALKEKMPLVIPLTPKSFDKVMVIVCEPSQIAGIAGDLWR